jgi:hypothetical protein
MTEIDWDVELRKIEREYDGLPPQPSTAELRARRMAEKLEREEREQRVATIGTWTRLMLVVALTAAVPWWPYAHACGTGLLAYLGLGGVLLCGAAWVGICSWRWRLAVPHLLAIALLVTALGFTAAQALPRLGYAHVAGVAAGGWRCGVR